VIATEWFEFRKPDFGLMKSLMAQPVIFDGATSTTRGRCVSAGSCTTRSAARPTRTTGPPNRRVPENSADAGPGIEEGEMIEGVMVKQLKVLPDERGRLMEILREDDEIFMRFGQVYLTTGYPGVVKAWHYHKIQFDHFCVSRG